jgi:hypothetical protein
MVKVILCLHQQTTAIRRQGKHAINMHGQFYFRRLFGKWQEAVQMALGVETWWSIPQCFQPTFTQRHGNGSHRHQPFMSQVLQGHVS